MGSNCTAAIPGIVTTWHLQGRWPHQESACLLMMVSSMSSVQNPCLSCYAVLELPRHCMLGTLGMLGVLWACSSRYAFRVKR